MSPGSWLENSSRCATANATALSVKTRIWFSAVAKNPVPRELVITQRTAGSPESMYETPGPAGAASRPELKPWQRLNFKPLPQGHASLRFGKPGSF